MLGLSLTVRTSTLAVILCRDGVMGFVNASGSALAVLPGLVGMAIGERIRMGASPEVFRGDFFNRVIAAGIAAGNSKFPLKEVHP